MQDEHELIQQVYAAKEDMEAADRLIGSYMPFIKSETAKFLKRPPMEGHDDELSIAMIAFHEAVRGYSRSRGAFLNDAPLSDTIADETDHNEAYVVREATRAEIEELTRQMREFGVSLSDVADNCPKQQRTLEACRKALWHAKEHPELLDELLKTRRLPIARLSEGSGTERKTLERHRKYMVALLLIYTNGYEIIRGHLTQVMKGVAV